MPHVLTCKCGERFDVPTREDRPQVSCPACGQPVDVPEQGAVGLSSAKFLAAAQAKQDEALQNAPDCPDCAGKGYCMVCRGSKEGESNLPGKGWVILGVLAFGFLWAMFMKNLMGSQHDAGAKYCMSCNGNGRCRRCKGCGKIVV
ncbi:MAG: hypothetical protein JNM56_26720 [Planctomycetia bacterium]|nr:hypothetical protein [Planctomycetia bacterium]